MQICLDIVVQTPVGIDTLVEFPPLKGFRTFSQARVCVCVLTKTRSRPLLFSDDEKGISTQEIPPNFVSAAAKIARLNNGAIPWLSPVNCLSMSWKPDMLHYPF